MNDWRDDICWDSDKYLSTKETNQVDIDLMMSVSWYLYVEIPCHRLIIPSLMEIYKLLVWMVLADTYGVDHTLCMIIIDEYHGLV